MNNVLVFSTSVSSLPEARSLAAVLDRLAGPMRWNFDLSDCDRILRVTSGVEAEEIIGALHLMGFRCEELGDEVPEVEAGLTPTSALLRRASRMVS